MTFDEWFDSASKDDIARFNVELAWAKIEALKGLKDNIADASRYRKLQARAVKKTAHDVYGNGCLWTVGLHSADSQLSFDDVVDALPT